jgi:hypothetical protein
MVKCNRCGYENIDALDDCDSCGAALRSAPIVLSMPKAELNWLARVLSATAWVMGPPPSGIKGFLAGLYVEFVLLIGVIALTLMVERALHLRFSWFIEGGLFIAIGTVLSAALRVLGRGDQ